jgi:hypothetical protein
MENDPIVSAYELLMRTLDGCAAGYPGISERFKLVIDPDIHNSPRHYGLCVPSPEEILIVMAPQAHYLAMEHLLAILMHEIGHGMLYLWQVPIAGGYDQRERQADSAAESIFGMPISYAGDLETLGAGIRPRPDGIR